MRMLRTMALEGASQCSASSTRTGQHPDLRIGLTIREPGLEAGVPQFADAGAIAIERSCAAEADESALMCVDVGEVHLGIVTNLVDLIGVGVREKEELAREVILLRRHGPAVERSVGVGRGQHSDMNVLNQAPDPLDCFRLRLCFVHRGLTPFRGILRVGCRQSRE